MAGGRAKRLGEEKALLEICGRKLIDYVLSALKGFEIYVAITKYTPKTRRYLEKRNLKIIKTSGKGYLRDAREAILNFKEEVLVISCDLVLMRKDLIEEIFKVFEKSKKSSLSVYIPLELFEKFHLKPTLILEKRKRKLVPAGLNVIDSGELRKNPLRELEEEIFISERIEFALNVNTRKDLRMAEKFLSKTKFL